MIHKRASANAVINKIMSHSKGIGESKAEAKSRSEVISSNGHKISTKIHSLKSTDNMRTITTQYVNFVKEHYGNRVVGHLNNDTMKEFIDHKLETVSQGTANTYISMLAKTADSLNELNIDTVSRNEITSYRAELRENGNSLQKNHVNRSNENPQAIVRAMEENSPYGLSTSLMYEVGLRADDALNFSKLTLNSDNSLYVEQSKNGLNYTTALLSDETAQRVAEAISNQISVNYGEYRISLKEAVESTGQEWKGVHSLRYDAIQQQYANGMSLADIALLSGHSREVITLHYITFSN